MKNEKNLKSYNLIKRILGTFFVIFYRPKIYNKELIPLDGPIILAGNHVHLFDQNLVIISTNRMIHYMAKIEYFQDKKKHGFSI